MNAIAANRLRHAERWGYFFGVFFLGLAAWLALPRLDTSNEPPNKGLRALLVDTSASLTRPDVGYTQWVRRWLTAECERAAAADQEVLLIEFDYDVVVIAGPCSPGELERRLQGVGGELYIPARRAGKRGARHSLVMGLDSDLAGALLLASTQVQRPDRGPGAVLIASDMRATTRDPRPVLSSLLSAGVVVEVHAAPLIPSPELALLAIQAPAELEEDAPLALAIEWALRGCGTGGADSPVELIFHIDLAGPEGVESYEQRGLAQGSPVPTHGRGRTTLSLPAPPTGSHVLRVRGELRIAGETRADAFPENDTLAQPLRVGGRFAIGIVCEDDEVETLENLLGQGGTAPFEGLELRYMHPDDLVAELSRLDAVMTVGIGPDVLPAVPLANFVRSGGGLITCGSWGFLRGWLPMESADPEAAQSLLPLAPRAEDGEPRDVILLVDGSGSMVGGPFDEVRKAAIELARSALPKDHIVLRFFTEALAPVIYDSSRGSTPAERERAIRRLLAARVPGGSTDILYCLTTLAQDRKSSPVEALVLLLTDGLTRSSPDDQLTRMRRLFAERRMQLRPLAVGADPDLPFLRKLIKRGEQLIVVDDLSQLSEILQREVHNARVREEPDMAVLLSDPGSVQSGTLPAELLAAWAGALGTPGELRTYARARVAAGAQVLWTSNLGEPLLALHPVGQGWVASLACGLLDGWAPAIEAQPGLLAPLMRLFARNAPPDEERPRARWAAGVNNGAEIWIEGLSANEAAVLQARLLAPDRAAGSRAGALRELCTFPMHPPTQAAGGDPRLVRMGRLPIPIGALPPGEVLQVAFDGVGGSRARFTIPSPRLPEFDPRTAVVELPPAGLRERVHAQSRRPAPAAPWFLGAGIGLLAAAALCGRWRQS